MPLTAACRERLKVTFRGGMAAASTTQLKVAYRVLLTAACRERLKVTFRGGLTAASTTQLTAALRATYEVRLTAAFQDPSTAPCRPRPKEALLARLLTRGRRRAWA